MERAAGTGARAWLAWGLPLAMVLASCSGGGSGTPDADAHDADAIGDLPGDVPGETTDAPDAIRDATPVDADATDETALELVEMGKARLSAGESLAAMDAFDLALRRVPDLQEAQWGMVLARLQSNVAMWGALLGLPGFQNDPDATAEEPAAAQAARSALVLRALEWTAHDGTVGVTIDGIHQAAMEQKARLDALKALPGDPVFSLPGGLPLHLGPNPMMTLCCTWDRSDLYGISSFNNLLLAFVAFLGSQDLDLSLGHVEDLFRGLPGLGNTLVEVLVEYPDLLTLLPGTGEASWRAAGAFVAAAADDALQAAALMAESDGAEGDVATLSANAHPTLVLHGAFPGGGTTLEVLWDGQAASLKHTVETVKAHLAGGADSRLSLDADVLVALGVLVDVVNRTVGLEAVVKGMGFALPDIVVGLIGSLDPGDPEQLVGLVGTALPLLGIQAGTVEVDLKTFFDSPFPLRDLMPNWGREPAAEYGAFLASFECAKGGMRPADEENPLAGTILLMDPSATESTMDLAFQSFATPDFTGDAFDAETLALAGVTGFAGIYSGPLALQAGAAAGTDGDGVLVVPADGSVRAVYTSAAHPEAVVAIRGNLADGLTPWSYSGACAKGSKAWDGPHFHEVEFASAIEVPAPGQSTPLSPLAADGKATTQGAMAFRSPSFDGLLWIDGGTGFAPADQAAIGRTLTGILSALEAF